MLARLVRQSLDPNSLVRYRIAEISVMYPTDIAKTRAQLNTASGVGMWSTLATIARADGLAGLYRGVMSPIVAEAPKRATKFAANDQYKRLLVLEDGSLPFHRAGRLWVT